ncbi:MAG: hypothetical protein RB296_03770 [Acidobacteriota bacterium]|nr:hypothetical protein [Acidobacteriota bacterium]
MKQHHWDGKRAWASRGSRILVGPGPQGPFATWARLGPFRVAWCQWLRRLTRRRIHQVIHLHDDTILVVLRRLLLVMRSGRIVHEHGTGLGSQPLSRGVCRLPDGRILYGEYGANPRRDPVRLMLSSDDGATWSAAWQSMPGEIRHIHMVSPVHGAGDEVFVAAGDYGAEPRLLRLNLKNAACTIVGSGGQEWRMLDLIQAGNGLIWGSDNDRGDNFVYRLAPDESTPRPVQRLPGPVYAAGRDANGRFLLATAVEDRRRHRACLFMSMNGEQWQLMRCFAKDLLPARLFGYGIASFPRGQQHLADLVVNLDGLREKKWPKR